MKVSLTLPCFIIKDLHSSFRQLLSEKVDGYYFSYHIQWLNMLGLLLTTTQLMLWFFHVSLEFGCFHCSYFSPRTLCHMIFH